jgi:competence protein ComEA
MERVFVSGRAGSIFAFLTQNRLLCVLIGCGPIRSVEPMQDVSPQMLVVYAAAVLAVALIGARYLKSASAERPAGDAQISMRSGGGGGSSGPSGRDSSAEVVVYVSGAVRRPGIVRLHDGDRVADAIDAAGGARRSADLGAVNLAARVADGQQVVVASRLPAETGAGAGAGGPTGTVSLSSATLEQLDSLDGVGPGLAQKILDYRAQHGGFRSVDELGEVPGIGEKRLESLRAQLQP